MFEEQIVQVRSQKKFIVNNNKYVYVSRSRRQRLQTWRCSFRSCKARIYVTEAGNVAGLSDDHNHDELSDLDIDNPPKRVLLHGKAKRSHFRTKKQEPTRQREMKKPGARKCGVEKGEPMLQREVKKPDGGIIKHEGGQSCDEDLDLPKLGTAFSVADCPEAMDSPIIEDTSEELSVFDYGKIKNEPEERIYDSQLEDPSISPSTKHCELGFSWPPVGNDDFTVTKDTRIMRNMLAEALERLSAPENHTTAHFETVGKPVETVAGPSHLSEPKEQPDTYQNHTTHHTAVSDHSYAAQIPDEAIENGGFWRCVKIEHAKQWEQEEEIDVDGIVEEEEEEEEEEDDDGSSIDDEEIAAMLGGPWI